MHLLQPALFLLRSRAVVFVSVEMHRQDFQYHLLARAGNGFAQRAITTIAMLPTFASAGYSDNGKQQRTRLREIR